MLPTSSSTTKITRRDTKGFSLQRQDLNRILCRAAAAAAAAAAVDATRRGRGAVSTGNSCTGRQEEEEERRRREERRRTPVIARAHRHRHTLYQTEKRRRERDERACFWAENGVIFQIKNSAVAVRREAGRNAASTYTHIRTLAPFNQEREHSFRLSPPPPPPSLATLPDSYSLSPSLAFAPILITSARHPCLPPSLFNFD